jgi:iron complex transport system ATP-binding protein
MKFELNNLTCGYNKEVVIEDVNLMLDRGEICCVLGPNGVGKTTLFKTILKLIPKLSGEVLIDGQNIKNWPASKTASNIGYVSQFHNASFQYTVFDIVLMGRIPKLGIFGTPKKIDLEATKNIIDDFSLTDLSSNSYTEISGGERELSLIARAINGGARVLMFDEPTANLDYKNTLFVLKKIKELSKNGYTILMTTHDPNTALLLNSKVFLMNKDKPPILGDAGAVITQKNLKTVYDINAEVKTFTNQDREKTSVIVPKL